MDIIIHIFTDEETGGYVSYQCVLPMHVHGSGYVQMQMISNSKAEKLVLYLKFRSFYLTIKLRLKIIAISKIIIIFSDSTICFNKSTKF